MSAGNAQGPAGKRSCRLQLVDDAPGLEKWKTSYISGPGAGLDREGQWVEKLVSMFHLYSRTCNCDHTITFLTPETKIYGAT